MALPIAVVCPEASHLTSLGSCSLMGEMGITMGCLSWVAVRISQLGEGLGTALSLSVGLWLFSQLSDAEVVGPCK